MHLLTMRLDRLIHATELSATFRQSVLKPDTDAEALIREPCADARVVMRSFDTLLPGTPEAVFFGRLSALDVGTVLPIALLFRSPVVTEHRRRRALRILESWLARRAVMG
jgi:hypothetical protein